MANNYDKNDIVRMGNMLRAGSMKIAAYKVKDPETGEFSSWQFHFTHDNTVMAVLGEQGASLFAHFVANQLGETFAPRVHPCRAHDLEGND